MENILDRAKRQAEASEVFIETSESTPVQFEANRLKTIQTVQNTSVSLRVIKDGRIGYATGSGEVDARQLVDMAVETAEFGQEAKFEFPAASSYPKIQVFDPAAESVSLDVMAKLGAELIAKLRDHTPELICDGRVSKHTTSVNLLNSRGGQAGYRQTTFSLGFWCNLIRGTDMLFVGDSETSCHPVLDYKTVLATILRQLDQAKNQAAVPTGMLPVIFTPDGAASGLIMPFMAAFNGKTVLEGASPIGNRLGETVFDSKLSLWDDPTIDYQPGSRPCDEEGVPSQRTPLIERGVVKNFYYDLQTAALAGKKSTGNGSRSRGGLPAPAPGSFVFAPGKTKFEEMLADIKEGLVIDELMGAEQGNVLGGDFSGNVLLGYKVENGKIVGRVKDTMVSGNIYQLFKDIAAIGNEPKWIGGALSIPHLYFSSVSVASK